jgi:hypothetical protein
LHVDEDQGQLRLTAGEASDFRSTRPLVVVTRGASEGGADRDADRRHRLPLGVRRVLVAAQLVQDGLTPA